MINRKIYYMQHCGDHIAVWRHGVPIGSVYKDHQPQKYRVMPLYIQNIAMNALAAKTFWELARGYDYAGRNTRLGGY